MERNPESFLDLHLSVAEFSTYIQPGRERVWCQLGGILVSAFALAQGKYSRNKKISIIDKIMDIPLNIMYEVCADASKRWLLTDQYSEEVNSMWDID